jgi:Ni/Co efflux regulator RcnB
MSFDQDIERRGDDMGRNTVSKWLAVVASCASMAAHADDALVEKGRAEILESSTHLVAAHNTGKKGSMRERQKEGYWCSFGFEVWKIDSVVRGSTEWKPGAEIRVFHAGQGQDCWRGHEYKTKGIDYGIMLPVYASETKLANAYVAGARGILLGWLRGTRDLELAAGGSIESPDLADSLGREWDRTHPRSPSSP